MTRGKCGTCSGGGEESVGKEKKCTESCKYDYVVDAKLVVLVSRSEFHHGVDTRGRRVGTIPEVLSFTSPGGMIVHLYAYFFAYVCFRSCFDIHAVI